MSQPTVTLVFTFLLLRRWEPSLGDGDRILPRCKRRPPCRLIPVKLCECRLWGKQYCKPTLDGTDHDGYPLSDNHNNSSMTNNSNSNSNNGSSNATGTGTEVLVGSIPYTYSKLDWSDIALDPPSSAPIRVPLWQPPTSYPTWSTAPLIWSC
jgi:hypothetical protein